MHRIAIILCASALLISSVAAAPPNIVVFLADDLGYGDLGCYNAQSKIPTPNLDRLAKEGMRFTDAHAPASCCTPTRYALLTGRYAWRSKMQALVLPPWAPPLIDEHRMTIGKLLQGQGYQTAAFGKWHLGWGWQTKDGKPAEFGPNNLSNVDFTQSITGGPTSRGFDHFFGVDTPDFPPFCFIENDRTIGVPTVPFKDRRGPALPGWDWGQVLPTVTEKMVSYVETASKRGKRFFMYVALTSPHSPVVPTKKFKGKSSAGDYGDFVAQTDWTIGQVLDALSKSGAAENTLVIFTSDNGPETNVPAHFGAYERLKEHDHASMGDLRGLKRDLWEGGHRMPFIARWPNEIAAGTVSNETICLTDIMATAAGASGATLDDASGVDSFNLLPILKGETLAAHVRPSTVLHSGLGRFAIRRSEWVLIAAPSGEDNDAKTGEPEWFKEERGYAPHDQPVELYNLREDLSQKNNVAADNPKVVAELREMLAQTVTNGRSTPGPKQDNDANVVFWRAREPKPARAAAR